MTDLTTTQPGISPIGPVVLHNKTELPPLGPSFLFDNSALEHFADCPRKFEYLSLSKHRPADGRPALNFGQAGHLVLDYRYRFWGTDMPKGDNDRLILQSTQARLLQLHFAKNPQPEGDWRDANHALECFVKHYNARYDLEPFNLISRPDGTPLVEQGFKIPFAAYNPVTGELVRVEPTVTEAPGHWILCYFCGKVDLPFIKDNLLYIGDHKTSSMLGDSTIAGYEVSPQQIGYCWAYWKLFGVVPNGFMVNFIRTRSLPEKPKGGIAAWWSENYFRLYKTLLPWHFPEWEYNTLELLREVFYMHRRGYFSLRRQSCSGKYGLCGYYHVCAANPDSRATLLAQDTFTLDTWSPLDPPDINVKAVEDQVREDLAIANPFM